jgi:hypothetical protein
MIQVNWADIKVFADARDISIQWIETIKHYHLVAIDAGFSLSCKIKKGSDDAIDFEVAHKAAGNAKLDKSDPDTGAMATTNQFSPPGFYQRLHEIEYTTSTLGGALHDKTYQNVDTGWSSVTFYKMVAAVETAWTPVDQADLDLNCIRTDYHFMPNVDYMIKSGVVSHQELINVAINGEIYIWGLMLNADAVLNIPPIEVLGGGMAMSFVKARDPVGLKGVNGSMLYHAGIKPPNAPLIALPPGMGTNRITFLMRHNVGVKHRFQAIFEIFKA